MISGTMDTLRDKITLNEIYKRKNINGKKVTYGKNVYDSKEINAVIKQLHKSTQMGKSVELFEEKISNLFGKKYGIMVNSGSSAITIALRLLKLPKNSEIITLA